MARPTRTTRKKARKKAEGKADASGARLVSGQRALAKAVGKAVSTVCGWVNHERWPFTKRGPWDVDEVRVWAAETLRDQSPQESPSEANELGPVQRARLAKLLRESKRLDIQNAIALQKYIDREQAKAEIAAQISATRTALLNEARAAIDDLDAQGLIVDGQKSAAVEVMEERMEALLTRFARGLNNVSDRTG